MGKCYAETHCDIVLVNQELYQNKIFVSNFLYSVPSAKSKQSSQPY